MLPLATAETGGTDKPTQNELHKMTFTEDT